MCDATKTIDFSRVIDGLIELGLAGVQFLCTKVKQSIEMARINNELLDSIGNLKDIVWQVDMIIKSKRETILMRQAYANAIASWTKKINELRITHKMAKESATCFRVAGYTNPVEDMEEGLLCNMMDSVDT